MANKPTYEELEERVKVLEKENLEHRQARKKQQFQRDFAIEISKTTTLTETLEKVLTSIFRLDEFDCGGIYLVNEKTSGFDLIVHQGLPQIFVDKVKHYDSDDALLQMIMKGETAYPEVNELPQLLKQALEMDGILSVGVIPIKHGEKIIGSINLASHTHEVISNFSKSILEAISEIEVGASIFRVVTEEALRASEEKFSKAFHCSPAIAGISDLMTGEYIEVNQAFYDKLGFTPGEVIGKMASEVIHMDLEFRNRVITKMKSQGYIRDEEAVIYTKDRTPRNVLLSAEIIEIAGKKYNYTNAIDISERKQAEESLRESEKFLRTVVENIPDMIFVKDANELRFVRINKAGEELLGYSREELVGKNDYDFFPKKEAEFFTTKDRNAISSREPLDIPEEPIKTKYKGERILHTKKITIFDEEKNPKYLLGISEDITERKHAEEERLLLEAQLQQAHKMEAIGTLAGGIAHDFNNILGIILGNTELAMDDIPEWNPASRFLNEIKTSSMRARDVVRQLLSFSRKSAKEKRPVKIHTIVKESVKLLRASIPTTIEIRENILPDLGAIVADPTQIHQVIINLCTNATHAMEKYGGTMEISLAEVEIDQESSSQDLQLKSKPYIQLTISDTGAGIDPEIKDRIFDPYFTTKQVGKGSGIGLSVVSGVVKSHDGSIHVYSQPDKGTTVKVYFPVIDEKPAQEQAVSKELPTGNESPI